MLAIVHGEDGVRAEREYRRLRQETDPDGLSTTILDDPKTILDDIVHAADALPFFGGQRFVGVRGFLLRITKASERGKEATASREKQVTDLAAYVARLPATTTLVFWEPVTVKLPAALEGAVKAVGSIHHYAVPSRPAEVQPWLEGWLLDQARDQGVALTREAVQRLAATATNNIRAAESGEREQKVGTELRRLVTDLAKLDAYAGAGGKVDGRAVAALAPDSRAQVFDLVDAVAARATPGALRLLEQALDEGLEPLALLRLLDRQVSNLLRADVVGGSERAIEAGLKVPNWLARKYAQQLRGLNGRALRRAHARILAADRDIKTGQARAEAAIRDVVLAVCLDGRRLA
jgi:DNA polymerase III delta subunit